MKYEKATAEAIDFSKAGSLSMTGSIDISGDALGSALNFVNGLCRWYQSHYGGSVNTFICNIFDGQENTPYSVNVEHQSEPTTLTMTFSYIREEERDGGGVNHVWKWRV